ncbi:MAG TPA: HDOD domain-containing protein [Phycisphaerae bacterium]|nr:HDOD domain-containing protein [Phycisphaerae bacterium]HNU46677.1 HDOD domain-containing protein [Phycisphaerae bacterium]
MAKRSVLLACPDDVERRLLACLLSGEGFDVREAVSVRQTVEQVHLLLFDLIVLDTNLWQAADMPALGSLKPPQGTSGPKVLLLGQPRTAGEVRRGFEAGASGWAYRKQFDVLAFLGQVRKAVGLAEGGGSAKTGRATCASATAPGQTLASKQTCVSGQARAGVPTPQATVRPGTSGAGRASVTPPSQVVRAAPAARSVPPLSRPPSSSAETMSPEQIAAEMSKLGPDALDQVLGRIGQIPVFEFSVTEAVTTTCTKGNAPDHIRNLVQRDPMLTLALLALARNAGASATTSAEAIAHLGAKDFYRMAEGLPALRVVPGGSWDEGAFWVHSLAAAHIAEWLSRHLRIGVADEAFTAGLLHDIGRAVLAHCFPWQDQALRAAGRSCGSLDGQWERRVSGVDHGELGARVLKQFGLPELLQDVVRSHHAGTAGRQTLKISCRVLALLVQAADQIASTLFPGDTLLTPLAALEDEFITAVEHAGLSVPEMWDAARKIVAELATEMVLMFAKETDHLYFAGHKPLSRVVYCVPRAPELDIVRTFLEIRSEQVETLRRVGDKLPVDGSPLVVNLMRLPEVPRQVEVLTSLMASGSMEARRGIVLLPPGEVAAPLQKLAPAECRLSASPSHPAVWVPWLATPCPQQAEPAAAPSGAPAAKSGPHRPRKTVTA